MGIFKSHRLCALGSSRSVDATMRWCLGGAPSFEGQLSLHQLEVVPKKAGRCNDCLNRCRISPSCNSTYPIIMTPLSKKLGVDSLETRPPPLALRSVISTWEPVIRRDASSSR